jgi:uncharacterized protein DUF1707/2TM domain-containing protein
MDRDQGGERRASLRASDADRERFVEALRRHHVDGRLTAEELEERTEQAYAARTFGDLDALAADLPPLQPPGPPPPAPAPGWDPTAPGLPPRMRSPGPRRAAAKANLLRSVLWYGLLSLVLVAVWAFSGRDYFWPVWPILGFMLLLGWQAVAVWSKIGPSEDDQPHR